MPFAWQATRTTRRSSRIDPAKRRIRRSRISPLEPVPARSRPDPPAARIGSANTISCSGSRRSSEKTRAMHKVVLLRHGESTWNKENRFTGWTDVDLSERGVEEAKAAGQL